jgi:microsomal dipeptidase-like Zn-dependent dipeptidase
MPPRNLAQAMTRAAEMPNPNHALLAGGYSEQDVRKIMGLNVLRPFGRVWKD